jgi:hypothetical protein
MSTKVLSPNSQKLSAQIFNFLSVIAIVLMPIFPILLVWIAASIVVYSANIYHPNPLVRRYTRYAGYRFYGFTGASLASMLFSGVLVEIAGGALNLMATIWLLGILIVVPMGIWSLYRAGHERWKEMWVEEA